MIRGVVNARHEAEVRLRVRGRAGPNRTSTRLLAGHELRVAVVPGGPVEISPIP